MPQLIARIPPDLHRRIKEKAAAEHRSMNAVITEALQAAVEDRLSPRERLERQAERAGLDIVPAPPRAGPVPTLDEIAAMTAGAGTVGEVIEADRARR